MVCLFHVQLFHQLVEGIETFLVQAHVSVLLFDELALIVAEHIADFHIHGIGSHSGLQSLWMLGRIFEGFGKRVVDVAHENLAQFWIGSKSGLLAGEQRLCHVVAVVSLVGGIKRA